MRGLSALLKEHGAAINADLMRGGWRRADLGRRLSWRDMLDFVENLPPTGESAYWRSVKPRSWWVTPEYVALTNLMYATELGNWQRAGGKKAGPQPKPPKLPDDKAPVQISADDVQEKRRAQREHLEQARMARSNRRKSVKRINPGREVIPVGREGH